MMPLSQQPWRRERTGMDADSSPLPAGILLIRSIVRGSMAAAACSVLGFYIMGSSVTMPGLLLAVLGLLEITLALPGTVQRGEFAIVDIPKTGG